MPPKTPYYEKYGTHPAIISFAPHKSGITPLSPLHPAISLLSPTSREVRDELEAFQKGVMRGYTSQWLRGLDVISERPFPFSPINLEVVNWIGRDKWDRAEKYTVEGMVGTFWNAGNDEVWGILKECLQLVSLMLAHTASHPWFDALLCSPRIPIPPSRFTRRDQNRFPGPELAHCWKSFSCRNPCAVNPKETEAKMTRIAEGVLMKNLSFGFMSFDTDPRTDFHFEDGLKVDALTSFQAHIKVYISHQLVAPLLREDLTPGERMAERVYTAKTIFHELMHVFNYAAQNFKNGKYLGVDRYRNFEPYFEEEAESELGLSAETAIFGGPIRPILTHNYSQSRAHLGFFLTSHPLPDTGVGLFDVPRLVKPGIPDPSIFMPIPVTYFAALHEEAFWGIHVVKYGMNGVLNPASASSVAVSSTRDDRGNRVVTTGDGYEWPVIKSREIKRLAAMRPDQKEAHKKLMKAELAAEYQPLTVRRDAQVGEVMNSAEKLGRSEKGSGNYEFFFGCVVEDLEALIAKHEDVVRHIPVLEEHAGTELKDTRNDVQAFHSHMKRYINSLLLGYCGEMKGRLEATATRLDRLTETTFLEAYNPANQDWASKYHLVSPETSLLEMLQAFDTGEHNKCYTLCHELTGTIDIPLHIQLMARVKLGEMEFGSIWQRLENVRRAVRIFEGLDMESVEEHLRNPVVYFANRGVELIGELEIKEVEELGKEWKVACGP